MWRVMLAVVVSACGAASAPDAGCTGVVSKSSTGEAAPGWAIAYDCSAAACAKSTQCLTGKAMVTAGTSPMCTNPGEAGLCSDLMDNDHSGLTDCNDCSCWSDAACASATKCEALPALSLSLMGWAGSDQPACTSVFNLYLVQSGCEVWAQMRGTGATIPSVGPIPLTAAGDHRWHLEWTDDLTQNGATNIYRWKLDADTSTGVVTGSFGRTTPQATMPDCGWTLLH